MMINIYVNNMIGESGIMHYLKEKNNQKINVIMQNKLTCDLLISSSNDIAFFIISDLNNVHYNRINKMVNKFTLLNIIVKRQDDLSDTNLYKDFLGKIEQSIKCVTFFKSELFEKKCADFITDIIEKSCVYLDEFQLKLESHKVKNKES